MRAYLDSQAAVIARARTAPRVPMTQAGSGSFAEQDTGVQGITAHA